VLFDNASMRIQYVLSGLLGSVNPSKPRLARIKALTDLSGQNSYQCKDDPEHTPQDRRISGKMVVNELRCIPACSHRNDNEKDNACTWGAIGDFCMTAPTN